MKTLTLAILLAATASASADDLNFPARYNVIWETPGKLASGSMPTGNGDISVNAWVEGGGDLVFYIGKTDAWSELERLLKIGRVRVKLTPNPFETGKPFRQELQLENGTITIQAGDPGSEVRLKLWVDANRPVIRWECDSDQPVQVEVASEIWRRTDRDLPAPERMSAWSDRDNPGPLIESADVIASAGPGEVLWYHRNATSTWEESLRLQEHEALIEQQTDPLLNRTFGALLRGPGFATVDKETLRAPDAKRHEFSLHVLTEVTDSADAWMEQLRSLATTNDATPLAAAWSAHADWWQEFWSRSHIVMDGPLVPPTVAVISPVTVPLRIGSGDGGSPFRGKIAVARLYGAALTSDEVAEMARQQDTPVNRPEALVGAWDLSRAGEDGTFTSQQSDSFAAKSEGTLVASDGGTSFDGTGHLQVAHDVRLDPTEALTLEAWILADAQAPEGGRIFDKGLGGTANGYMLDTYPRNSLRLISSLATLTAPDVLPAGEWAHVAATLDGLTGAARLYVNGRMVAEQIAKPGTSRIQSAADIAQVYTLQRFLMAASSRGQFPPKFNGGIFNVDYEATGGSNADYRHWGGPYWFQNTRHLHWPNLADGDFDLMDPFFRLYLGVIDLGGERVRAWFGHEGSFFPETMSFWGTYGNSDYGYDRENLAPGEVAQGHISRHLTGNLEFLAMMIGYYRYTGDSRFAREKLLPAARKLLLFWDRHYSRDDDGKLSMDPAQAMEAYWDVKNPASDVAGLTDVLDGLLALPDSVLTPEDRETWTRLRAAVPSIPIRQSGGKDYLAAAAEIRGEATGPESPELYSIHPFPLFGVGKPDLARAIRSYWERPNERPGTLGYNTCWSYLSTVAARLGLTDEAARLVASRANLFWGSRFFPDSLLNGDWIPDLDNTGSMAFAVQSMLLQTDGQKILLLPAWPKQWSVRFKLHAPQSTTVEVEYVNGKITKLDVQPPERRADVVNLLPEIALPPL